MVRKWTKIVGAAVLALGATVQFSYKSVIHNVMSHYPVDMSTSEIAENLPKLMFTRGWYDAIKDGANCIPEGTDLNAIYLGKQKNPLPLAKHRPTAASIPNDEPVYDPACLVDLKFGPPSLEQTSILMLQRIRSMKRGDIIPLKQDGYRGHSYYWDYGEKLIDMQKIGPVEGFGNFTLSIGYDNHGKFLSFYDVFDFKVGNGGFMDSNLSLEKRVGSLILSKVGKPIYFYKRWDFDEVGITDDVLEGIWQKRIWGGDSWFKDSPEYLGSAKYEKNR